MRTTLHYLRLLLWLKSRLLWRLYTRNTSALVGALLLLLFFLPMSLLSGFGLAAGLFLLPDAELRVTVLRGALLAIYFFWVVAPLFAVALSEEWDAAKLLYYPITPRQLLVGMLAGSVLDFPVLLLGPALLVALAYGTGSLWALPFSCLLVLAFLIHTLGLNQALKLAGAGLLNSRRSREIIMALSAMAGMGIWAFMQIGLRRAASVDWQAFSHSTTWKVLGYTPPALAASGLDAARRGDFLSASLALLGLLALGFLTIWLSGYLVNLAFAGEGPGVRMRARRAAAPPPPVRMRTPVAVGRSGWIAGLLPPVAAAMAEKDSKLLVREPFFRMMILQSAFLLVVWAVMLFRMNGLGGEMDSFGAAMAWFMCSFVSLVQSPPLYNLFGVEGYAAATLFLFPASRRHLLLGKNLTFFSAFALLNLVLALGLGLVSRQPDLCWRLALWMVLLTGMNVTVGNFVSIWFPYRVVMRGRRLQPSSASKGVTYGLVSLVTGGASLLLALPAAAAIVVPTYFLDNPAWMYLTLPLAVLYVLCFYLISLGQAEKMLQSREMAMVEQLSQPD